MYKEWEKYELIIKEKEDVIQELKWSLIAMNDEVWCSRQNWELDDKIC